MKRRQSKRPWIVDETSEIVKKRKEKKKGPRLHYGIPNSSIYVRILTKKLRDEAAIAQTTEGTRCFSRAGENDSTVALSWSC